MRIVGIRSGAALVAVAESEAREIASVSPTDPGAAARSPVQRIEGPVDRGSSGSRRWREGSGATDPSAPTDRVAPHCAMTL